MAIGIAWRRSKSPLTCAQQIGGLFLWARSYLMAVETHEAFCLAQIERLQALIAENTGVKAMDIDGQRAQYVDDWLKELERWRSAYARARRRIGRVSRIRLDNG